MRAVLGNARHASQDERSGRTTRARGRAGRGSGLSIWLLTTCPPHTYTHSHTHTHILIYILTEIVRYLCTHSHTQTHIHTHLHTHTHMYIHSGTVAHSSRHTHTYTLMLWVVGTQLGKEREALWEDGLAGGCQGVGEQVPGG